MRNKFFWPVAVLALANFVACPARNCSAEAPHTGQSSDIADGDVANIKLPGRNDDYAGFYESARAALEAHREITSLSRADVAVAYFATCSTPPFFKTRDFRNCVDEEAYIDRAIAFYKKAGLQEVTALSVAKAIKGQVLAYDFRDPFAAKPLLEDAYFQPSEINFESLYKKRPFLNFAARDRVMRNREDIRSPLRIVYLQLGDKESYEKVLGRANGNDQTWRDLLDFNSALQKGDYENAQILALNRLSSPSGGYIGHKYLADVAMAQGNLEAADDHYMVIYRDQLEKSSANTEKWDFAKLKRELSNKPKDKHFDHTWMALHLEVLLRQGRLEDALWMACKLHRGMKEFQDRLQITSRFPGERATGLSECIRLSVLSGKPLSALDFEIQELEYLIEFVHQKATSYEELLIGQGWIQIARHDFHALQETLNKLSARMERYKSYSTKIGLRTPQDRYSLLSAISEAMANSEKSNERLVELVNQRLVGDDPFSGLNLLVDISRSLEQLTAGERRLSLDDIVIYIEKLVDRAELQIAGSITSIDASGTLDYLYSRLERNLEADRPSRDRLLSAVWKFVQLAQAKKSSSILDALKVATIGSSPTEQAILRKMLEHRNEAQRLDDHIRRALVSKGFERSPQFEALSEQRARVSADIVALYESNDFALLRSRLITSTFDMVRTQSVLGSRQIILTLCPSNRAKATIFNLSSAKSSWRQTGRTCGEIEAYVNKLRQGTDFGGTLKLDQRALWELSIDLLGSKNNNKNMAADLIFILDGPLTSLPPQMLLASEPADDDLSHFDWLIKSHTVTVMPAVEAIVRLASHDSTPSAPSSMIGYANPDFGGGAKLTRDDMRGISVKFAAGVADLVALRGRLPQLPETAKEVQSVGKALDAVDDDLILGMAATEADVKARQLDKYRVVYFATHGLIPGEVETFTKLKAQPALVMTLPVSPNGLDDGLLTASEIVELKLNADWVVLSACNTATGDRPGATALSGLARAFMVAGARGLLVSHWPVESESAAFLMVRVFQEYSSNKSSAAKAVQTAMLKAMENKEHPEWKHPAYWAPFILVGQPRLN